MKSIDLVGGLLRIADALDALGDERERLHGASTVRGKPAHLQGDRQLGLDNLAEHFREQLIGHAIELRRLARCHGKERPAASIVAPRAAPPVLGARAPPTLPTAQHVATMPAGSAAKEGAAFAQRDARRRCMLKARLHIDRGTLGCRVHDISLSGLGVEVDPVIKLAVGQIASIECAEFGALEVVVRWGSHSRYGLELLRKPAKCARYRGLFASLGAAPAEEAKR